MTWNIERISRDKASVPGMLQAIGKIVANERPDILIILEVSAGTADTTMAAIAKAAESASEDAGEPGKYLGWLSSYETGGECYGLLIRDLNVVKPVVVAPPNKLQKLHPPPNGENGSCLTNLDWNTFRTWHQPPSSMPEREKLPLIDIYSKKRPIRKCARVGFGGKKESGNLNTLSRGFRMPCLMLFSIQVAGRVYLLPIISCHLGAVRSGANPLALGQVRQYNSFHICNMYTNGKSLYSGGYLCIDGNLIRVQNLLLTGDFNIDFLLNISSAKLHSLSQRNNSALSTLTPTEAAGGSEKPAAIPDKEKFGDKPVSLPKLFDVGENAFYYEDLAKLDLRTGITKKGTMLKHPVLDENAISSSSDLVDACFDNFFFGGKDLIGEAPNWNVQFLNRSDAAKVVDIIEYIDKDKDITAAVKGMWSHYIKIINKETSKSIKHSSDSQNLNPTKTQALNWNDKLIGARFISDHLPIIIDFDLK